MRIDQLGLIRYGHFTDAALDFPAPEDGQPDLHVIFGPNEAGKSTLFSAWLDLLFGMPLQTPYNFLHDNRTLRIEAQISAGDTRHTLARLKGRTNTLRDAATDETLPESTIAALLGGLDRAAYSTMFSLDDETLEDGGESILASKGDLGQLLFSASAGLAELSDTLRVLSDENAAWFRPNARKFHLADQKARLAELTETRKAADLPVSDWRRLRDALTQAEAAYNDANTRRAETQARKDALHRNLDALPRLARLTRAEAAQDALPAPDPLPADWPEIVTRARREDAEIAGLQQAAKQAQAQAQKARADLPQDAAARALVPEIEGMEPRFGVIAKEQSDLPRRREELAELDAQMTRALAALGRPDLSAREAALPATTRARLGTLVEEAPVLHAALTAARSEHARAQEAVRDAPDTPPLDPQVLDRLAPMLAELRRADLSRALAQARAARDEAQASYAALMAQLAPFDGTLAALLALDLPGPDALRTLARAQDDAAQATRAAQTEHQRLSNTLDQMRAEFGTDLPDSAPDPMATRADRDAAWTRHRRNLDADSADAFEQMMRRDDSAQAAQIALARHDEELRQLRRQQVALTQAQAQLDTARAAQAEADAQVAALWAQIAPQAGPRPLADLIAWAEQRRVVLAAHDACTGAEAELAAITARMDEARAALSALLSKADPGLAQADYATLLAAAEALLQNAERMTLHARQRRDLAARTTGLDAAQTALAAWQDALAEACATCWIGTPPPDAAQLRAMLGALADLDRLIPQADALDRRITRIEEDTSAFQADLARIAQALDHPADAGPLQLWPQLRDRLRQAARAIEEEERLRAQEQAARDQLAALEARLQALAQGLAPLRARLGDLPLDDLAQALEAQTRANQLAAEVRTLRDELATHLGAEDLDTARPRLAALDSDQLQAEEASLRATLKAQDHALQAAYADLMAAERALNEAGHDGEPARIEAERQTLLIEMAEDARRYLARQASIVAVEMALRRYRDTHRSGMMREAARAFADLTGGRYSGLTTRPDGARETLIAQLAGGGAKPVDTLSKGTRFQLYLALRAAGYLELAGRAPSVPFIADDIMETFDDTRAHAAFRLLAHMGMHGQVIYLTHHSHLCDIARAACPSTQVHDLTAL
ncbi:MAG: hypothetical protein EA386_06655 [Rhodobacteraceae bacterium]|nr:MAG: hypothetical protein EA386_06655 [Paracoccaceae bacterium]